jgi:hypothetical protein
MKEYKDIDMIHQFIGEIAGITFDKNDILITNEILVLVDDDSMYMT